MVPTVRSDVRVRLGYEYEGKRNSNKSKIYVPIWYDVIVSDPGTAIYNNYNQPLYLLSVSYRVGSSDTSEILSLTVSGNKACGYPIRIPYF